MSKSISADADVLCLEHVCVHTYMLEFLGCGPASEGEGSLN